jgi:hypothetical protein
MKENYFFVFQKREREKKKDHPVKEGHTRNATIPQKKKKRKKKTPTPTSYSKEQYNKCVYKNKSMRDRKFQVLTFQL